MKTRFIPWALTALTTTLLLLAGITNTSCTGDEFTVIGPEEGSPAPDKQITIIATLGSDAPGTRISYEDSIYDDGRVGLKTKWAKGDKFSVRYSMGGSGNAHTFTLKDEDAGKSTGRFSGSAPSSTPWEIFHPATIKSFSGFDKFSYVGQVQKGNNSTAHLSDFHCMYKETKEVNNISFAKPTKQSSCMKFELALPATLTNPILIALGTGDGKSSFYSVNEKKEEDKVAFLPLALQDVTLAPGEKLTAYMMMSCQTVTLPEKVCIIVTGADNIKYHQVISVPGDKRTLEGGKRHSVTVSNADGWATSSSTYTENTQPSTTLYTADGKTDLYSINRSPYLINSAEDLKLLQNLPADSHLKNKLYKLTTDITIDLPEGTNWNPIGKMENPFNGTFYGDGHTVKGVNIDSKLSHTGFFGWIKSCVIMDLHIEGNLKSSKQSAWIGGICGGGENCRISGCSFKGNIESTNKATEIGGIAGCLFQDTYIYGCYNTGSVKNSCEAPENDYNSYCGGIVGNGGSIVGCYNRGTVTSKINTGTGGIAGSATVVMGCYNIGCIQANTTKEQNFGGGITFSSTVNGCLWVKGESNVTKGISNSYSSFTNIFEIDNLAALNAHFNINILNEGIKACNNSDIIYDCNFKFQAGTGADAIPVLVPATKP